MVSDLRARISGGGGSAPTARQAGYRVEVRTPDVLGPEPAATVENYSALLAGVPSADSARAQGAPLPTVVLVRIPEPNLEKASSCVPASAPYVWSFIHPREPQPSPHPTL